jgi:hypothetical protein
MWAGDVARLFVLHCWVLLPLLLLCGEVWRTVGRMLLHWLWGGDVARLVAAADLSAARAALLPSIPYYHVGGCSGVSFEALDSSVVLCHRVRHGNCCSEARTRQHLMCAAVMCHSSPGAKLHSYGHLRLRSLLAATRMASRFQPAPCPLQFSSLGSIPAL